MSNDVIKTGYIPVEYSFYKELVRKAAEYDKLAKQINDAYEHRRPVTISCEIELCEKGENR